MYAVLSSRALCGRLAGCGASLIPFRESGLPFLAVPCRLEMRGFWLLDGLLISMQRFVVTTMMGLALVASSSFGERRGRNGSVGVSMKRKGEIERIHRLFSRSFCLCCSPDINEILDEIPSLPFVLFFKQSSQIHVRSKRAYCDWF